MKVVIVGGSRDGMALLNVLHRMDSIEVVGVVDIDEGSPGFLRAKELSIPVSTRIESFFERGVDVILEATGDETMYRKLQMIKPGDAVIIPGRLASVIIRLVEEKTALVRVLHEKQREIDTVLNSTYDGLVAVNKEGLIFIYNRAAERILGIKKEDALGKWAEDVIPNLRLHTVLRTCIQELNQEQALDESRRIVMNRVPILDRDGRVHGAVAVFRDITKVATLTNEIITLKDMQSLLMAIIQSSDDAISVVDTHGNGLMINPAYTRLTGLTEADVIGKPADVDISEGESMHMQVLRTGKPVRGVPLKVGPKKRDVVVNVAPVVVDGVLKGSVGIIHDVSEIKKLTEELERVKRLVRKLEASYTFDDIIGTSEEILHAIEQGRKAARTPATVLLRGESGTGKELFAHAIHNESDRKYNQFIRVNCASIPDTLLESELFGYEEGAFTGAKRGGKKGLFEEASGGTIFLDEIGELSMSTQAKLLRVLQEKEIVRIGGTKAIPVDVRVIAATHVNLERAIQAGAFREDLYYRINVLPIVIPPLRYRMCDMEELVEHLIHKYNQEYGRNVQGAAPETLERLKRYTWPGNVRELENVISRSIINMKFQETLIQPHHLPELSAAGQAYTRTEAGESGKLEAVADTRTLNERLEEVAKAIIAEALTRNNGNKTATAKQLGLSIRNLYYKIEKYGL
ncbi:sigma 54-interacting transcriptional regulator [Aneurinibacillus thermoaerophilus]|uniref:Sigma 54-interacting transcriptional regulator n=1 Tax=Aneurinibacillus thermoaerophilus TaxID=143495 RepID=A0ABX8YDE5_ANETH|nr:MULTISPECIES: sigma-54-dependent Fis family transcriptional regulator [Aneurinibacillus]AMA73691.1 AAA family ATPase [Aneurinibacillus sp. XH2]QYY43743.1 sigma 54-interacting transcriptional regulator [Aneurinibacillus thermoaerophilus]